MLAPYMLMSAYPEIVFLPFRFQINGTSDPDNCVPGGAVLDVVRTGAGVFTINFAEKYPIFIGLVGTVLEATPAHDLIVKAAVGNYTASTGVLTGVTVVGADGTTAAEDPIDNDWVYVIAAFSRRSVLNTSAAL